MLRVAIYRRQWHLWRSPNGDLCIVWSDRGMKRRRSTKTKKLARNPAAWLHRQLAG